MPYHVTKTYGHEQGLSCVFRQWRANSHCALLHGYALSFSFKFGCSQLDENGWVLDFGDLAWLKHWLHSHFDHTLLIATDDPLLARIEHVMAAPRAAAKVMVVDNTGCEAFAYFAYQYANSALDARRRYTRGVRCISVTVREHGANSATYHEGPN